MQEESAKTISKKSKSSFYYAFNLLPAPKRDAMNTVYAFCRKTDDIVDENSDPVDTKYLKLVHWRTELEKAFHNDSTSALLNKVARTIGQFNIPMEPFFELIKGMEMDLRKDRYETFEELHSYCYRVASCVGLMCIEIFGYKHPSTKAFAENLGLALQLTNIIRDVKKDAKQGRIYLPLEDLRRFHYTEEDIFNENYNLHFVDLMEFQVNRAKSYFEKATRSLNPDDKLSMFAARAMQHIYYRTLERIIERKYNIYDEHIRVPKFEKVGIALGVWVKYNLLYR